MSKLVPIIVIVAVLIAGGAYYTLGKKSSQIAITPENTTVVATEPQKPVAPSAGITVTAPTYNDGVYTADGAYQTPENTETITVTLTLKNGIVVDSSIQQNAREQKSVLYQQVFAAGYKEFVTGKKITDINIGVVSGSSLTGKGFNAAVASIVKQAKA
ncbi:MAG: hypothetical protein A2845_01000 [Candidatus Lloydbacteria bacterium RIFCSPHIGHO2_01_FULL_49_22]|uniref:FMN-binding domain-containing protein n=1 Tax=Candidatus Lloydbacteria bacterium RIFCSPHIGHO2_01_FULL_49_22 TaxID=1798658 RepID=A0A1G2CYL5_9BACT|nr:MAG: hypothetical protein A2845_01000 [Candidatus Lloydbacteria bacterium RIFCSPHIGHO2_01_FULL_49_22]OGZ09924.1 MAG: hypothetical protein A3C14_04370 [Candidatus Lloydbacteria bacterium RIFCSPHIGHO2_02_FULL_50_18]